MGEEKEGLSYPLILESLDSTLKPIKSLDSTDSTLESLESSRFSFKLLDSTLLANTSLNIAHGEVAHG